MNRKHFSSKKNIDRDCRNVVKRTISKHGILTDILDEANFCFSFQVWYSFNLLFFYILFHFIIIIFNIIHQIMVIFGLTFLQFLLNVYISYRYIFEQHGKMRVLFWTYTIYHLPFIFSMLTVVYYADKLTNEVFEFL